MGGGQSLVTSWGRIPDHKRCEGVTAGPRLGGTEMGDVKSPRALAECDSAKGVFRSSADQVSYPELTWSSGACGPDTVPACPVRVS